jgi:tRNA(Ile)-lysidine synthase
VCSRQGEWKELPVFLSREAYEREEPLIRKRVLYHLLCVCSGAKKDIQERHVLGVDGLFGKPDGKRIQLAYGLCAAADRDGVRLEGKKEGAGKERAGEETREENEGAWEHLLFSGEERSAIEKNSQLLPQGGCIELKEAGKTIQWRVFLKKNACSEEKRAEIPKKNYTKWFDYDKISNAALFRTRRAGDWFVLDSSGKHKKLKQYFIDEKIPKQERSRIPLLADENHIIWIIGRRISEEYKVRETTRLILELRVID